uniref:ABC transporter n=1 Tax=Corynoplastis japonica TaxID=700918 RepID=A0A1X9PU59_9RHOD|nr:ABC transporter [Corynoplastis japonica]
MQKKEVLYPLFYVRNNLTTDIIQQLIEETKSLTTRLIKQSLRRYTTLLAGIIQPLLWQILFGALFQKISITHSVYSTNYSIFLSAGIIVFTAFSGALNAGLPIMFDREFGFFNRLLVISLTTRFSIVLSSICFMTITSFVQSTLVMGLTCPVVRENSDLIRYLLISVVILLIIITVTIISLSITFYLPGHIELLAFIFIINLPLLFISTALAPIEDMPIWLKITASLNPLTYSIEAIRYLYTTNQWSFFTNFIYTIFGPINLIKTIGLFVIINCFLCILTEQFFKQKLE